MTLNTSKPITVVTQFISNGAEELVEIKRKYIQEGKVFEQPKTNLPDLFSLQMNTMTDDYCADTKMIFNVEDDTTAKGGLK